VLGRIHALAHITGGGIAGNLVRVLPGNVEAVVDPGSWEWPPLFRLLQQAGTVSLAEMREVFNLGAGLIAVVSPEAVTEVRGAARADGVDTWVMGDVRAGSRAARFAD
jgi:phosphoribosylformylglycinamidine cyclo-ligase